MKQLILNGQRWQWERRTGCSDYIEVIRPNGTRVSIPTANVTSYPEHLSSSWVRSYIAHFIAQSV